MRNRGFVVLVLLIGVWMVGRVAWSADISGSPELMQQLKLHKQNIRAMKTLPEKIKGIAKLKDYLRLEAVQLKGKDAKVTGEIQRAVSGVQTYLEKIDTDNFDRKKCPNYRSSIYFLVGTSDPEQVPEEATYAVSVLDTVCSR